MIILKYILLIADSFLIGWMTAWLVFDYKFHQPLRKLLHEALNSWEKSINMLEGVANIVSPQKNPDGSMISPIQLPPKE